MNKIKMREAKEGEDIDEAEIEVLIKRFEILDLINKQATFFGLYISNASYLGSFVVISFVILRFMSTSW
jgi:hypothetical protein